MNINSGARGSIYSDLSNTLKGRGDKNRGGPRFMSSFISHFSNLRLKFLPFKVHICAHSPFNQYFDASQFVTNISHIFEQFVYL
jgi:hypothetical protein